MKKLFAIIFSAIIISASAFAISGCGCNNENATQTPATDIVGNWGGRSDDVEAEFNDDGSCIIGGITGTYEIDENNTLTVTPNSNGDTPADALTFEYYSDKNTSAIQPNQWTVADNVLYINGHQYNGVTNTPASSNTQSDNSNNSNNQNNSTNSSSNSSNNTNSNNSSNSTSSSSSNNAENSGNTDSSNSNNSSDTSDSSTPTDTNNSSSSTPDTSNPDEESEIVDIVENIDDF